MDKALWKGAQSSAEARAHPHAWSRKMSDHIAFSLLVYTGLNIIFTVGAIKGAVGGSILPYFSLVILVALIIPGCRWLEHRWARLDLSSTDEARLRGAFRRDRLLVWLAALSLPFIITGVFKALTGLI